MPQSKTPQLRFKGFSGEWEEKKIIDIAPLQRGFDLPKHEMKVGFYPVVMSNGINCYHSVFKVKAPGIVTGRSGTIGVIHYVTSDYWPHNTTLWVTDFKENIPIYIFYMYTKFDLNRFATGSGVPTLNRNDVHGKQIFIPNLTEQTKIGEYFQRLDALIEQKEKKYQKLKQFKTAMLSQMFPKEGEHTPKLRFKGFSGEWEAKQLGDIGEIVTGSTPSTQKPIYYSNNGIPWVTPTDISKNITFHTAKHLTEEGQKVARVVPKNTILVTSIASIGKNTLLGTLGSFNQQINGLIPNEKENNSYFLFTESILWSSKMKRIAASGTMQIINKKEFSELKTYIPSIEEQTKIGNYFQKLDTLIDLHQKELEKLKNMKKALLAKMFL